MEIIDLDPEEANELMFRVQIEGIDPSPAKIRLVCEGQENGYVFNSKSGPDGLVRFDIPAMKGKIAEGRHSARIEVMIENKYFVPIEFDVNFKKKVSVVAESVVIQKKIERPSITVTARPEIKKVESTPHVVNVRSHAQEKTVNTLRERVEQRKKLRSNTSEDDILDMASRALRTR